MRHKILVLGAVVSLVVASACSSNSRDVHPIGTAPGPNPDVIPAIITPAYVDAVFKVLNHIYGDSIRSWLLSGTATDSARADLRAIFSDPLYGQEIKLTAESLSGNLDNVRRPPGDRITSVLSLIDNSPSCIFVATRTDYSRVLVHDPPATGSEYWALARKPAEDDPNRLNPTPWVLTFNASYTTPTSIPDQCAEG